MTTAQSALFGSSGTFDGGTSAANLPGVLTAGGSVFDLTDPRSFPISSPLTLVVGGAATAAAAGVKEALMVSIDTAATRAFVQTSQDVAKGLGVKLDTLFIPPDTTDFAPVAAQIAERKPGGLGLILTTQMVPFFNALADENISAHDIPIFTAVTLMPPEVVQQLGSKADGVYLLTQQAPPSDTQNPGIQQMLKELKDAGFPSNGDQLSPASTGGVGERAHARRHPQEASAGPDRQLELDDDRRCDGEGRADQPAGDRAVRLHGQCVPRHLIAVELPAVHP